MKKTSKEETKHDHGGKSSENFLNKKSILQELKLTEGMKILDAGCGNGYMAKEFAKLVGNNGKVYALDPHEPSINILKHDKNKSNIDAFIGDITNRTKLLDASIDLIYISTVIHGFDERQMNGFVCEVLRILKPGGDLAIVEIKKEDTPFGPPITMRLSPEDLIAKIKLNPTRTINIDTHFYLQLFKK